YNNGDYVGKNSANVTFADGVASMPVTISIVDDQIPESSETFGLVVQSNPNSTSLLTSASFTITDNDPDTPTPNGPSAIKLFADELGEFNSLSLFALASYSTVDAEAVAALTTLKTYKGDPSGGWKILGSQEFPSLTFSAGEFTNGNAAALVARSSDALVLSFRGTDFSPPNSAADFAADVADWPFPQRYYDKFATLIQAVDQYVVSQGIHQVYVAGHSLGAAMVHGYMDTHQNTSGVSYEAVTIATPGYWHFDFDSRTVNFLNEDDPIKEATELSLVAKLGIRALLNVDIGTNVYLVNPGDDNNLLFGDGLDAPFDWNFEQHGKGLYQKVIQYLSSEAGPANIETILSKNDNFVLPTGATGIAIGGGQFFDSGASANTLVSSAHSEALFGGQNDDAYVFNVFGSDDVIVDSSGSDVLKFSAGTIITQVSKHGADDVIGYHTADSPFAKVTIFNYDAHLACSSDFKLQVGDNPAEMVGARLAAQDHLADLNSITAIADKVGETFNAFAISGYSAAANLVNKTVQFVGSLNPFANSAGIDSTVGGASDPADGITQTMNGFTNLIGTQLGDRLIGDGQDNIIDGGDGGDRIEGGGGNDTL